jgi:uroporphyrinogen III methyltransferase/synthase
MTTLGDGTDRWLVFTSANGVHCFFRELRQQRVDLRTLHRCRFAVIGPATAKALADHGVQADLCPKTSTSAALADALCGAAETVERVLLFRSAEGTKLLPERLAARYAVEDIALYDMAWEDTAPIDTADYITFASSGGVTEYLRRYGQLPAGAVPVSIGPVTAETLARTVGSPCLSAPEISTDGIVRAILEHHHRAKGRRNAALE